VAAPVVDSVHAASTPEIDESVVWDVYRALCGALLRSDRTEVWSLLTNPELRASEEGVEDHLFRAAAFLLSALRVEASGGSPAEDLRQAHALLQRSFALSEVRIW
jgi:hypothetical protein